MTDLTAVRECCDAYRESYSRTNELRTALRIAIEDALALGATQSDVARKLGLPRQHVHRLLRHRAPTPPSAP